MSRTTESILQLVYCRVELNGSILNSLDDCLKYGDITRAEHEHAHRVIGRWINNTDVTKWRSVTLKRLAFKKFIQDGVYQ